MRTGTNEHRRAMKRLTTTLLILAVGFVATRASAQSAEAPASVRDGASSEQPAAPSAGSGLETRGTPDPARQRLGFFVGAGYLASPGANGAALAAGLRLKVVQHFAVSLDLGYGLVGAATTVQDRWWVMPSLALVVPGGPLRFELGVGVGLGASSGYTSWPAYTAAPFTPVWAFQLVPAARAHVLAAMSLSPRTEFFARLDATTLLLEGNALGFRAGNPHPGATDTVWVNLWVGLQFGLL